RLAPLGRDEAGHRLPLRFDTQAALALLVGRNPNVADNLAHLPRPGVCANTIRSYGVLFKVFLMPACEKIGRPAATFVPGDSASPGVVIRFSVATLEFAPLTF